MLQSNFDKLTHEFVTRGMVILSPEQVGVDKQLHQEIYEKEKGAFSNKQLIDATIIPEILEILKAPGVIKACNELIGEDWRSFPSLITHRLSAAPTTNTGIKTITDPLTAAGLVTIIRSSWKCFITLKRSVRLWGLPRRFRIHNIGHSTTKRITTISPEQIIWIFNIKSTGWSVFRSVGPNQIIRKTKYCHRAPTTMSVFARPLKKHNGRL